MIGFLSLYPEHFTQGAGLLVLNRVSMGYATRSAVVAGGCIVIEKPTSFMTNQKETNFNDQQRRGETRSRRHR